MTSNQFYKGTPFKAGDPRKTEPCLRLEVIETVEERKHIRVRTKGGTNLLLAFDGKAGWFHLHKYTPSGRIGGHVYNAWDFDLQVDQELVMAAAGRWGSYD